VGLERKVIGEEKERGKTQKGLKRKGIGVEKE
jgi:hypothetical protein